MATLTERDLRGLRHRRAAPPLRPFASRRLVKQFSGEAGRRVAKSTGQAGASDVVTAVDGVDLEIADGEFFSMLGPSGSGKTTTLRMIAGFDLPTEGRVRLHGVDVTQRPPFERDVNTVFQDYALFPHMTVGDNVALRADRSGRSPKAERQRRVGEALAWSGSGLRAAQALAALGRPAPARRARAGAREPAPRAAPRRAARRARPQAARGDAAGAQGDPAARSASPSST